MLVSLLCGPSPTVCTAPRLSTVFEVFGEHTLYTPSDIIGKLLSHTTFDACDAQDMLLLQSAKSFQLDASDISLKLREIERFAQLKEKTLFINPPSRDYGAGFALVYFEYKSDALDFLNHVFLPEKGTSSLVSNVITVGEALRFPSWIPTPSGFSERNLYGTAASASNTDASDDLPWRQVSYFPSKVVLSGKRNAYFSSRFTQKRDTSSGSSSDDTDRDYQRDEEAKVVSKSLSDGREADDFHHVNNNQKKRRRENAHQREGASANNDCNHPANPSDTTPLVATPLSIPASIPPNQEPEPIPTINFNAFSHYYSILANELVISFEDSAWLLPLIYWAMERWKAQAPRHAVVLLAYQVSRAGQSVSVVFAHPLAALLLYDGLLQRLRFKKSSGTCSLRVAFGYNDYHFPEDCDSSKRQSVLPYPPPRHLKNLVSSLRARSPTPPRVALTGLKIGTYKISKRIGKGNNAVVVLGEEDTPKAPQEASREKSSAAIKILFTKSRHAESEVRTLRAAQASPHTPIIYSEHSIDLATDDTASDTVPAVAVAMEHLGCDLFDLAHGTRADNPIPSASDEYSHLLPIQHCMALILSMLGALRTFHTLTGMVHGSVKLENFCTVSISDDKDKVVRGMQFADVLLGTMDPTVTAQREDVIPVLKLLDYGRARHETATLDEEPFTGWWYSDSAMIGLPLTAVDDLVSLLYASTYLLLSSREVQIEFEDAFMEEDMWLADEDDEPFRQFVSARKSRLHEINARRRSLASGYMRSLNTTVLQARRLDPSDEVAFDDHPLEYSARRNIPLQLLEIDNQLPRGAKGLLPSCTPLWWRKVFNVVLATVDTTLDQTGEGKSIAAPAYSQIVDLIKSSVSTELARYFAKS